MSTSINNNNDNNNRKRCWDYLKLFCVALVIATRNH